MIYLHKILPLFLSPILLFCLLAMCGLIKNNRKISMIAIVFLYVVSTPLFAELLFRYAENYEIKQDPKTLPKTDAIVVLSGMMHSVPSYKGASMEWDDPDRFFGGIELYKLGKSEKLMFTRGVMPWDKNASGEGEVLKNYAKSLGIPENNIAITDVVQNTEGESIALRKLFKQHKPSIILVTSAFHMPRAQYIFENNGFVVYPYIVDFRVAIANITPMDFLPSSKSLRLSETAIREAIGLLYYRITSWIGEAI